jgi:hypothetical protein
MLCTLSNLQDDVMKQIQSLEKDLDQTLLAFSSHDINPALVDAEKLASIQDLEKKLGISLVAVKNAQ